MQPTQPHPQTTAAHRMRTAFQLVFVILWAAVLWQASLALRDSLLAGGGGMGRRALLVPLTAGLLTAGLAVLTASYHRSPRAARWWIAAILVLAAGLRLAWALQFATIPISDFALNHQIALDLSQGRVSTEFGRNLGYPAVLSLVYRLQPDPLAGRLLNVVFGVLSVYFVYRIGAAALHPLAGLYAALFLALSAPEVMMTSVLATEVGALSFVLGASWGLLGAMRSDHRQARWAALAGLLLGMALLFRPVAVVLLPLFLFGAWRAGRGQAGAARLVLVLLGGLLLTHLALAGWHSLTIRAPSLKSLELGTGAYTIISGTNAEHQGYYNLPDAELYWSWPREERSRRALALAYERIAADPARFARLVGTKMTNLLADDTYGLTWSLYPLDGGWTPLALDLIRLRFAVVAQTLYWLILAAGLVFYLRVPAARHWLPFFLAAALLLGILPHVLTEAQPRYHHGLLGFLALAAGGGVFLIVQPLLRERLPEDAAVQPPTDNS